MQPLTTEAEIEDLQASIIGLAENVCKSSRRSKISTRRKWIEMKE